MELVDNLKLDNQMLDDLFTDFTVTTPNALIYYCAANVFLTQNALMRQGKTPTEIFMMKSYLVDDLEILCKAKGIIKDDVAYNQEISDKMKELGLPEEFNGGMPLNEFWIKKARLANYKIEKLMRNVFRSAPEYRKLKL